MRREGERVCVCMCEEEEEEEEREREKAFPPDGEIDCQLSLGSSLLRTEIPALRLLYYSYRGLFCAI